jgi:ankyrin repeat protein
LDTIFDSAVEGTGQWLFESEEYKSWKIKKESAALWIKGKNGCGKSVLASAAITEIRQTAQVGTAVAYFFCSSLQEKTRDPQELLGSLLRQLCEQQSTIDRVVEKLFDQKGTAHTSGPSWKGMTTALKFIVANFSKVYLICDGLDECQSPHQISESKNIFEFLYSLSQTEAAVVKVLILSRPGYDTLEDAFSGCPVLEMDNGANDDDIKKYIAKTLSISLVAAKDEKQLLDTHKTVFTKAEGMFLYVTLLATDLQGSRTANQLQSKLKSLPKGLDQVYSASMQRIFNEPDDLQRKWALDMLFWAANAKRRLTRAEMLEAIVIEPGMKNLHDGDRITRDRGLTSLCGDLIRIDNEEYYNLVHSSLKDYLFRLPLDTLPLFEEYKERQARADYVMGEICLTYLLFSKFRDHRISTKQDLDNFRRDNPFFNYAATSFADGLSAEAAENLRGLILEFLNCVSLRNLVLQVFHAKTFPEPGNTSELILLSIFNLIDMAKSVPALELQQNCPSPFGLRPLEYAIIHRSKDMCLWLLENGSETVSSWPGLSPLHRVAFYDWADVVDKLLLLKYNVNARDPDSNTPLLVAARFGKVQAIERLLKEATVDVNSSNDVGETPLIAACDANHANVVFQLLNAGAGTTMQRHNDGWTALHLAAACDNIDMIRILLQSGADIEAQAKKSNNWTPIAIAAGLDAADAVELLYDKGAHIESRGENGSTPLHAAARNGAFYASRLLIRLKASVAATDYSGRLPLTKAAAAGHLEILKLLLKAGPTAIDWQDGSKQTPLHHAASNGHKDVVAYLLEMGAQIDIMDLNDETALHIASSHGHTAVAELLLLVGSDPELPNKSKFSVMHMSSQLEHSEFIEQLLRMVPNIEINPKASMNSTPLHLAAMKGLSDTVRVLLEFRADATARDDNNDLPMHLAAMEGYKDVVCQLIGKADVDARGFHGRTALHLAAARGYIDLVQVFLEHGADANIADSSGFRPILDCLEYGYEGIALLLLEQDVQVDFKGPGGWNPLHVAARTGSEVVVKALLGAGCNARGLTDAQETPLRIALTSGRHNVIDLLLEAAPETIHVADIRGCSPVHLAAKTGDLQSLDKLIERGADPRSCDKIGNNALYYAAASGNIDLANRLLDCGVNVNGSIHEYQSPPLCVAAMEGHVDLVIRFLEIARDIDCADKLTETTPVMWASGFHRPTAVEVMLAAKADPFHRDVFGLNAIDYATEHPETLAKFDAYMPRYRPLDKATQQHVVRKTIIRFLGILLDMGEEVGSSEQELRLHVTTGLGEAFGHCADSDAINLSRICHISSRCPAKGYFIYFSYDCSICKSYLDSEGHFKCTVCYDVSLCSKCHASYVKGWKTPKTAPEGFQKLEALEKQLHAAMKALFVVLPVDPNFTGVCMNLCPSVAEWFAQKKRAYEAWETTYNTQGDFKHRPRPGQECLKLLAEVQTIYSVFDTENTENCKTEGEKEFEDALAKKLESFASIFKADQDFQDFVCEGHEFMNISREEQEKLQANGDLNEHGQLAKEWLSTMLARFRDGFQSDLNYKEEAASSSREGDASKVIEEEPSEVAEDSMTNLSEDVSVKGEPYQGIMKQPLPPVEQLEISNQVAQDMMMDVESRTGEIPALNNGEEFAHESLINDPIEISVATDSIPTSIPIAGLLALAIAIKLVCIVVADGGGAEVREDILRCENILRELMARDEGTNEHDEESGSQHDAEDVGGNEIVESSASTSALSSAVAQNTDST